MDKYVVILAAGKGTGMNSRDPVNTIRRPVAHGLFGLNPRSARLAPARTVEDAHLYAQIASRLQSRA